MKRRTGRGLLETRLSEKIATGTFAAVCLAFYGAFAPHAIPSVIGWRNRTPTKPIENTSASQKESRIKDLAVFGATLAGFGATVGYYAYNFQQGHSEYLLLPVVTNFVSGADELRRYASRRFFGAR